MNKYNDYIKTYEQVIEKVNDAYIFLEKQCDMVVNAVYGTKYKEINKEINDKIKMDYLKETEMLTNIYKLDDPDISYEITEMSFDFKTRKLKIIIIETKKYRTIVKYVQRNYIKTPIYGEVKTKTKRISKVLILKNAEMDKLIRHEEKLIAMMSYEIMSYINIEHHGIYLPKWYIEKQINKEQDELLEYLSNEINIFEMEVDIVREGFDFIKNIYSKIKFDYKRLKAFKRCMSKLDDKINNKKIKEKKRIKLQKKSQKVSDCVKNAEYICIKSNKQIVESHEKEQEFYSHKWKELIQDINVKINKQIKENKSRRILELKTNSSLNNRSEETDKFVPLESIYGMNDLIIGCYVIRNIENKKIYVGQSKDVLKRLKTHFDGTRPKNIIFAEDYYTTKLDKTKLFEVCIIKLGDKGQLDDYEKALIEKYNSFKKGYNRTSGNV